MKQVESVYDNPLSRGRDNNVKDWSIALKLDFSQATKSGLELLYKAAKEWDLCACGNLCELIPRESKSLDPVDSQLFYLGEEFAGELQGMRDSFFENNIERYNYYRKAAIYTHELIENRATEILIEMGYLKPI